MDYPTMQVYAAQGFKMVRNNPSWVTPEDFNYVGVDSIDWVTKFVISTTGGSYTPIVFVNGLSSAYTPTGADSAATDWTIAP